MAADSLRTERERGEEEEPEDRWRRDRDELAISHHNH